MKKITSISIWTLLISAFFWGCHKESYVAKFDELPQERMADQIKLVQDKLTGAENGWIGTLTTNLGGGYGFYMQFDKEENISMVADLTDESSSEVKTSKYRIRQDMGAALTFDTYTYISILNNPEEGAFGGVQRDGFKSDIDFIYDHSSEDSIVFIGKRYRQVFSLVKASAAQKEKYTNGGYLSSIKKMKDFFTANSNLYFDYENNLKVSVEANSSNSLNAGKRITFTAIYPNDSIASSTEKFAYTLDELKILNNGLMFGGMRFLNIVWKDATTLALYDSTGKEYLLKNSPTPLLPLYKLWGSKYNGIYAGFKEIYPGTSQKGADILNYFNNNLCGTGVLNYCFNYGDLTFTWNVVNHRLELSGFVSQNGGNSGWSTKAVYNYTVDDNGIYSFTVKDGLSGGYCDKAMLPLYDFMRNNQIKFNYYVDGADVYGEMISVNDPSIVMTFILE